MNVLLLGAPGSGKGTQARFIQENHHFALISMGNILREEIKNGTPLGKEIQPYMEKGLYTPDDLILRIFEERFRSVQQQGVLLDGMPRTLHQARQVDEILEKLGTKLNHVVHLAVNDEAVIHRLAMRVVCKDCGTPYTPECGPKIEGTCDKCMGTLGRRQDDEPDLIRVRLKVYNEQTEPLVTYYRESGRLRVIDGMASIEDVAVQVGSVISDQ